MWLLSRVPINWSPNAIWMNIINKKWLHLVHSITYIMSNNIATTNILGKSCMADNIAQLCQVILAYRYSHDLGNQMVLRENYSMINRKWIQLIRALVVSIKLRNSKQYCCCANLAGVVWHNWKGALHVVELLITWISSAFKSTPVALIYS
jgi:hypothetical protein